MNARSEGGELRGKDGDERANALWRWLRDPRLSARIQVHGVGWHARVGGEWKGNCIIFSRQMQTRAGVHSSCLFLRRVCGKFKGVFPARGRLKRSFRLSVLWRNTSARGNLFLSSDREMSANPSNSGCFFWGRTRPAGSGRRDAPRLFPARPRVIFARFGGAVGVAFRPPVGLVRRAAVNQSFHFWLQRARAL